MHEFTSLDAVTLIDCSHSSKYSTTYRSIPPTDPECHCVGYNWRYSMNSLIIHSNSVVRLTLFMACLVTMGNIITSAKDTSGKSISGKIVDTSGQGVAGVMVSAIDDEQRKWISVFTDQDGTFAVEGLRGVKHHVRTRLMGLVDQWESDIAPGTTDLTNNTQPAHGEELQLNVLRAAFSMLKFDDPRDRMNFKDALRHCRFTWLPHGAASDWRP